MSDPEILKRPRLREIFGIPPHVVPVAYLCVGYPERFLDQPELEVEDWRRRQPLDSVIYYENWGCSAHADRPPHDP